MNMKELVTTINLNNYDSEVNIPYNFNVSYEFCKQSDCSVEGSKLFNKEIETTTKTITSKQNITSYDLEYGHATLEIHKDAVKPGDRVVIVDDLIATGGTLQAIVKLIERLGGTVVRISCLIDLPDLKGKERLSNYDVVTFVEYEGE